MKRSARTNILLLFVAVAMAMYGCTPALDPTPTPRPTAQVTGDGFAITTGTVTVRGPAGVAPSGTSVTIREDDSAIPDALKGVESAAAFDVSFAGGLQPEKPVTITLDLNGTTRDLSSLFFLTKRSDSGAWEGLPVTVTGDKAQVTLSHFSVGWFGWADTIKQWFVDQVKQYLQLGYDQPACLGQTRSVGDRTYKVSGEGGVYPCVKQEGDHPIVTIQSNSPFVWRYRPPRGQGVGLQGTAPVSLSGILTVGAFDAMAGYDYRKETVLVPGGEAAVQVNTGVADTYTRAKVDPGLGLIAVLIAGLDMVSAVATGQKPTTWLEKALKKAEKADDIRTAAECMARVIGDSNDVAGRLGAIANTVMSCAGSLLTRLVDGFLASAVGVVIGIVTSLIGLLVTQVWGLIGELAGWNEVSPHLTSTVKPTQEHTVLSPNRLGPFRFGLAYGTVEDALRERLGKPTQVVEEARCPFPEVGLARIVSWGNLSVEFVAPNDSRKRADLRLTQWSVKLGGKLPEQVEVDPSLPNASLKKLRESHREAKLEELSGVAFLTTLDNGVTYVWSNSKAQSATHIASGEIRWCWDA